MILQKISLRFFRQFVDAEVELTSGVTAIVGPNGSGKSTLLEAISWALYGEQRETKDTIKHLWEDGKPSVILEFSLGARQFVVERMLDKATFKEITEDGEAVLASSLTGVTHESERLLKLTYEQFKNSFCTEQKQLDFLKFRDSDKQQEQVAKMLGIDNLRSASKLARERAKEYQDQLKGLKAALEGGEEKRVRLKEAQVKLKECAVAAENLEREAAAAQQSAAALEPDKAKAEEAQKIQEEMKHRRSHAATLKKNRDDAKTQVAECETKLKERDGLKPLAKEYEQIQIAIKDLEAKRSAWEKRKEHLHEIARLEKQRDDKRQELGTIPKTDIMKAQEAAAAVGTLLDSLRKQEQDLRTKWQTARSDAHHKAKAAEEEEKRTKAELERIEAAIKDGKCPECGQPIPDGHTPKAKDLQDKLKAVMEARKNAQKDAEQLAQEPQTLKELPAKISETDEKFRAIQSAAMEAKAHEQRRASLQKDIEGCESAIKERTQSIASLPETFEQGQLDEVLTRSSALKPSWEKYLSLRGVDSEIAAAKKRYAEADEAFEIERREYDSLEKRLAEIGFTAEQIVAALKKYDEAKRDLDLKNQSLQGAKSGVEIAKAEVRSYLQAVEEYEKNLETERQFESARILQKEVADGFSELRDQLNASTKPELEQFASEMLSELTDGRYVKIVLNDKFQPTLYDDDVGKKVISGGESDVLALALRIGMTKLIQEKSGQQLCLLILDEVFGSLDPVRRQSVIQQLDALRGQFEQILVISHIEDINEAADRCLRIEYDPNTKRSTIAANVPDFSAVTL